MMLALGQVTVDLAALVVIAGLAREDDPPTTYRLRWDVLRRQLVGAEVLPAELVFAERAQVDQLAVLAQAMGLAVRGRPTLEPFRSENEPLLMLRRSCHGQESDCTPPDRIEAFAPPANSSARSGPWVSSGAHAGAVEDIYYQAWIDVIIERGIAEFAAEQEALPPLPDVPPAGGPLGRPLAIIRTYVRSSPAWQVSGRTNGRRGSRQQSGC